jgi:hypothetical protein
VQSGQKDCQHHHRLFRTFRFLITCITNPAILGITCLVVADIIDLVVCEVVPANLGFKLNAFGTRQVRTSRIFQLRCARTKPYSSTSLFIPNLVSLFKGGNIQKNWKSTKPPLSSAYTPVSTVTHHQPPNFHLLRHRKPASQT